MMRRMQPGRALAPPPPIDPGPCPRAAPSPPCPSSPEAPAETLRSQSVSHTVGQRCPACVPPHRCQAHFMPRGGQDPAAQGGRARAEASGRGSCPSAAAESRHGGGTQWPFPSLDHGSRLGGMPRCPGGARSGSSSLHGGAKRWLQNQQHPGPQLSPCPRSQAISCPLSPVPLLPRVPAAPCHPIPAPAPHCPPAPSHRATRL